ncbi:DUF3800 domain-containing protein [Arenibacter certesii]|uniref:DUF3800 domain-containing protein n=1 Tax=Arenibacter certesii TaxID=228955 RepID=A0A918J6B4_9FLAO|nr:DUF3800 domain-containing protein [Arenibacter certesii]GGW49904.1 hypothetical protein GCM10007383_37250 [Arenibacter certesii]
MEEKVYIYGDEFGTSSMNLQAQNEVSHFVYSAIVVSESNLDKAYEVRDYISKNFFQGQRIRSKSRAIKNIDKRLKALQYLSNNLDFKIYTVIVDKSKIKSEGLQIKEIFYKYFQKIFTSNIISDYQIFEIYVDELISEQYKNEMYAYLNNRLSIQSLFSNYRMVDDKNEVLVQLADLVAGSLGRVFAHSHYVKEASEIVDVLIGKMTPPEYFPYRYQVPVKTKSIDSSSELVTRFVIQDAMNYINQRPKADAKIDLLKFLYFCFKIDPNQFVDVHSIQGSLSRLHRNITVEQIRVLIRDLRYDGILVVTAAGRSGYKLAKNESDISAYFNHYLNYVKPMLRKMEVANNKLKKLDVDNNLMDSQEFLLLKQLISVSEKF